MFDDFVDSLSQSQHIYLMQPLSVRAEWEVVRCYPLQGLELNESSRGCLLLFIVDGRVPALSLICQQMAALAVIQSELALFGSIGFLSILLIVHHCSPLFTIVHRCSPLFTIVHHCSPLITIVHVWCLVNLTIIVGFSQRILNNFNIPLHPLSNPKFAEGLNLQNLGRNLGFH